MSGPTILLADDDTALTEVVAEFLQAHGFTTVVTGDGLSAVEVIRASPPDLVVLDLTMPGMDGLSVCRTIRPFYSGPVLLLTALVDDIDEVAGLETGADDYVRKPVRPRVLLARIRSLLRRATANPGSTSRSLELGALCIDPGAREVSVKGEPIPLTTAEFDLLLALATRAGEVVTRDELYHQLRGISWDGVDRSMDLRVSRLRSKLEEGGAPSDWIKSVRGVGYQLVDGPHAG